VKSPKVTLSLDTVPFASPKPYLSSTWAAVAWYVDDFEGSKRGISDAQVVHEVVVIQKSEEPVSRTILNVCALCKNKR